MFNQAHVENRKHVELEMKKAAESEKQKVGGGSRMESQHLLHHPIQSSNVK